MDHRARLQAVEEAHRLGDVAREREARLVVQERTRLVILGREHLSERAEVGELEHEARAR